MPNGGKTMPAKKNALETHTLAAVKQLKKLYPEHVIPLHHKNAWQLLCAVILSAQCTDARVNTITPQLFKAYPTVRDLAAADLKDVEKIIHSAGFYHSKALSLTESSKRICEVFDGEVPQNMEDLLSLRGVARKTANVMLGDYFKKPAGIVVDTHVKRLAFRLGLTKQTDPVKVEKDLTKIIPYEYWGWIAIALILHGRQVCIARKPACSACKLAGLCPRNGVKLSA